MVSFHDSPETYSDDHMLAKIDCEVLLIHLVVAVVCGGCAVSLCLCEMKTLYLIRIVAVVRYGSGRCCVSTTRFSNA